MHASLYLSVLTIIYFYISFEVVKQRRLAKVSVGYGEKRSLLSQYVSASSNFAHYTPLFVILLIMAEQAWSLPALAVHIIGSVFVIGRLIHFKSLSDFELREKPIFKFRVRGMMMTFFPLLGLALYILAMYFVQLAKAS